MLAYLGLAIDEDNLDEPLKQIGDGVDANLFGTTDSTDNGKFIVFTSRDVIFIKECIAGGPLPKEGMSIEGLKRSMKRVEYVGRPDPNKEFLYDIVSNKHSGFDFDKVRYIFCCDCYFDVTSYRYQLNYLVGDFYNWLYESG
jgi:hypothetical protein